MAANDEFPRGGRYSTLFGPASLPQILIPPLANITHVLERVSATVVSVGAVGPYTPLIQLSSATTFATAINLGQLTCPLGVAGSTLMAQADIDDIMRQCVPGDNMVIAFSAVLPAAFQAVLSVHFHDT